MYSMTSKNISIFTDGASRGNPGPASIGIVAYAASKEEVCQDTPILFEHSQTIGNTTNNIAEWTALVKGLQLCIEHKIKSPNFYLDSELVVKQLKKIYKVKNINLKDLYQEAVALNKKINASFFHVPREHNKKADALANKALD